jgi:hypothetical protein
MGVWIDSEDGECLITEVNEGSPAARAGLQKGDVIVRFDRRPVRSMDGLRPLLLARKPGDEVEVEVRRGRETVKVRLKLGPGRKDEAVDVSRLPPAPEPLAASYLYQGRLTAGAEALEKRLAEDTGDDQARFGLGVVRFLQSFEHLGQGLYRCGLKTDSVGLVLAPRVSSLFPENPRPAKVSYADVRKLVQEFTNDLNRAEAVLALVKDDKVKMHLQVGRIKLDLLGLGKPVSAVVLFETAEMELEKKGAETLVIGFDRGDVSWLRGYIHFLAAWSELLLAVDGQEMFETTGHRFFANVDSPHKFLLEEDRTLPAPGILGSPEDIFRILADLAALAHQGINLPVKEPERLKTVLEHLRAMVRQGQEMWKHILAETDDDQEWIPNPRQTSVTGVRVTAEMTDRWSAVLNEVEQVLDGKLLLPFWRGKDASVGVNLPKVFTSPPRRLDLVLWVQGTAATPYLEKGKITALANPRMLTQLDETFGGWNFFRFAFWFN